MADFRLELILAYSDSATLNDFKKEKYKHYIVEDLENNDFSNLYRNVCLKFIITLL